MSKKKVGNLQNDRLVDLLYSLSDALDLSEKIENSSVGNKEKLEFHIVNALHIAREFLIHQELDIQHDAEILAPADRPPRKSVAGRN